MNRLTIAAFAAFAFGMLLVGLVVAAPPAPAAEAPSTLSPDQDRGPAAFGALPDGQLALAPDAPQAASLDLWVSETQDGEPVQSVMSTTNQVWAVVDYEEAFNENYLVQMRDQSGIVVASKPMAIDGTGRRSVAISVTDFVNTYTTAMNPDLTDVEGNCISPACTAVEAAQTADANCENPPPVPPDWPDPPVQPTAPPGQPTPTPAPNPYRIWLDAQLSEIGTAQSATAEMTRTAQSILAMPDVRNDPVLAAELRSYQSDLQAAFAALEQAKNALNPQAVQVPTPTPTPEPQQPDPARGCQLIESAANQVSGAATGFHTTLSAIENVADWALPPTGARWDGDVFQGCLQYKVDLLAVIGGRPQSAPSATDYWAVGQPGPPRLIFPAADLVEANQAGQMRLIPQEGTRIYAQSVGVPDVNHAAYVSAFVTDAQCIPVDGQTMLFSVPEGAGSVTDDSVTIERGVASTEFVAGNDPINNAAVVGFVATDDSQDPPVGISANAPFQVVGPASQLRFQMDRDRIINIVENGRLSFSVQVRDEFGRNVADGTQVQLTVPEADPAVIAYELVSNQSPRPGRPTPTPEVVVVGKAMDVVTGGGMTQLPSPSDPGVSARGPFLTCTGIGEVTLSAVADGVTENTNVEGLKSIQCVNRFSINLPITYMELDIYAATSTPLPIHTETPMPSR